MRPTKCLYSPLLVGVSGVRELSGVPHSVLGMGPGAGSLGEVLAELSPGPDLAALLASVDLAAVSDVDIVDVLKARDRQGAHERAQFLRAVLATGLRSSAASGCGPGELGPYAWAEVRAGLMVTPNGAEGLLEHASELFVRLPVLGEAMLAGGLDESRARVFTNWMPGVPDVLASRVCEKLVAKASGWTTSQLRERIKRMLTNLDPEWARKRYEAALEERDVLGYRDPEGTATLTGRHLPVNRAIVSSDRIDRLAKSAKCAGDPRRMGHLRAEVYLGLLDGTYVRMDDAEIVAHLLANRPEDDLDDDEDFGDDPDQPGPDDPGPDDPGPDDPGPDDPRPDDPGPDVPGPDDPGPDEPDDEPGCADENDEFEPEVLGAPEPEIVDVAALEVGKNEDGTVAVGSAARGGVELQVRLSTLLGADDAPAELAGWGPIHSALARTIAAGLGAAEWRWAVTTPDGYLCAGGITRLRPTGTAKGRRTDSVLEIAIPATLLDQLIELTERQVSPKVAAWLPVLLDIRRRIGFAADKPPPDPGRRFPDAALRREVQMALRRCIGVGCRRAACKSEIDHTVDHAFGGPTTGPNLGPACGRDHRLKHIGRWGLERTGPHSFTWTSPLGRRYVVDTPPVIETYPAPEPTGIEPPPPWFASDDRTPWQLTTTWGTPEGPAPNPDPDPEPEPDPGPDPELPLYLELPPF